MTTSVYCGRSWSVAMVKVLVTTPPAAALYAAIGRPTIVDLLAALALALLFWLRPAGAGGGGLPSSTGRFRLTAGAITLLATIAPIAIHRSPGLARHFGEHPLVAAAFLLLIVDGVAAAVHRARPVREPLSP